MSSSQQNQAPVNQVSIIIDLTIDDNDSNLRVPNPHSLLPFPRSSPLKKKVSLTHPTSLYVLVLRRQHNKPPRHAVPNSPLIQPPPSVPFLHHPFPPSYPTVSLNPPGPKPPLPTLIKTLLSLINMAQWHPSLLLLDFLRSHQPQPPPATTNMGLRHPPDPSFHPPHFHHHQHYKNYYC